MLPSVKISGSASSLIRAVSNHGMVALRDSPHLIAQCRTMPTFRVKDPFCAEAKVVT